MSYTHQIIMEYITRTLLNEKGWCEPLSRERVRVGVVRVRVRVGVRDRVRLLRYADVPSYDSITDSRSFRPSPCS